MKKKFKHHKLNQSCLYKIKGLNQLSKALMNPLPIIEDLAEIGGELYLDGFVKSGTKMREVENPDRILKSVQARMSKILMKILPPEFLFNPVKRRSQIDNAIVHKDSKCVWTVDVRSYFPNTTPKRVYNFFLKKMKCSQDVAYLLTRLSTRYDHLPTGAPSSPIIAFYANIDMWMEIFYLCKGNNLKMTLYMDDLTISGEVISGKIKAKVLQIIAKNNFKAHKVKSYINRPARVTGPILNKGKIDVPHAFSKKIRLLKNEAKRTSDPQRKQAIKKSLVGLREYKKQVLTRN